MFNHLGSFFQSLLPWAVDWQLLVDQRSLAPMSLTVSLWCTGNAVFWPAPPSPWHKHSSAALSGPVRDIPVCGNRGQKVAVPSSAPSFCLVGMALGLEVVSLLFVSAMLYDQTCCPPVTSIMCFGTWQCLCCAAQWCKLSGELFKSNALILRK